MLPVAIAGTEVYEYDELGRLKTVTQPDGVKVNYGLDAAGNRKTLTTTPSSGVLSFTMAGEARGEGAGTFQVTITRAVTTTGAVGVTLGVGGSATQGVDYTISPTGSIPFASGVASATVTITIVDDTLYEATDETVQLVLSGETGGAAIGMYDTYTLTITNNDAAPDTTPPGLPGVPTFTNITHQSVTASWAAATDNIAVTGYEYRVDSGAWQDVGNVLTASITGLTASTNYTVQLRARDAQGNRTVTPSSASFTTSPPPDSTPPSVPGDMSATATGTNSVTVTWLPSTDSESGVLLYSIERCQGAGCTSFAAVGSALHDRPGENPPLYHSYVDTTVSGYTTYRYRIRARDGANNYSAYTAIDDTTTPDLLAPTLPISLVADALSTTSVGLTWAASTDSGGSGIAGYRIERCTNAGCTSYSEIGTSSVTSYTDSTVSAPTTYRYRVRAYDVAGNNGPYSSAVTIAAGDTIPPSAPSNLVASVAGSTRIDLTWSASTDSGGSGLSNYLVERCVGSTCTDFTQIATPSLTSHNDQLLTPATTYRYRVRARDSASNLGPYSTIASATTNAASPPTVPQSVFANPINMNSVRVTWHASTATDGSGMALYAIERCTGAGCTNFSQLINVTAGDPPTSTYGYTDSTVTGWTTYRYQIRARDLSGNYSGYSAIGTATTPDTINPLTPSGLTASPAGSTRVSMIWNAASDSGGSGLASYRIERCSGAGCSSFAEVGSTASTSYNDDTVSGMTTYRYQMRSRDGAGNNSGYTSPPVTVTTPDSIVPTTPTSLTASAATGPLRVNLSWGVSTDSGGSGLAGYRVYRGGSQIGTTTATSYSDTTVAAGTTYSYTVAAYDNSGNPSLQSNTASATTPSVPTATVSDNDWHWTRQVNGGSVTTTIEPDVVVTATGGSGGYTYLWERVGGDTQTSVVSPTSNSTKWSRSVTVYFTPYVSTWRCRVTDSAGAVTYTPNVTVTFLMEDQS